MNFERKWDFNPTNKQLDLNALRYDDETRDIILELVGVVDPGTGSMDGQTVDTDQHYRVILFSNGTAKAIPFDTADPVPPTDLARAIRIASVTLSWTASVTAGSKTYEVFRDNVKIATTSSLSYRDGTVVAGQTYAYKVRTIDAYGQASVFSSTVTAFVDPGLNVAPVANVRAWPPAYFTDGKTLIRVNASDADAQSLTIALGVSAGSIQATDDPSIFYYIPA